MWNRKLNKRIDWILFRMGEVEDMQKRILELTKRREEREVGMNLGDMRKDRIIKIKEKVWKELEKEAKTNERDPAELAGVIIESNYILRCRGEEYED